MPVDSQLAKRQSFGENADCCVLLLLAIADRARFTFVAAPRLLFLSRYTNLRRNQSTSCRHHVLGTSRVHLSFRFQPAISPNTFYFDLDACVWVFFPRTDRVDCKVPHERSLRCRRNRRVKISRNANFNLIARLGRQLRVGAQLLLLQIT